MTMRLVAIPGSLRAEANSRKVLATALATIGDEIEAEVYDGYAELPAFDQDIEYPVPAPVARMRERLGRADGLLIVTPEYNASIPGGLKNAVDWASRPAGESVLAGLPAAIISNSDSPFGATWAGEQLRRALVFAGTEVIESELVIGKVGDLLGEAEITDEPTRAQVSEIVSDLTSAVGATFARDRDHPRAASE